MAYFYGTSIGFHVLDFKKIWIFAFDGLTTKCCPLQQDIMRQMLWNIIPYPSTMVPRQNKYKEIKELHGKVYISLNSFIYGRRKKSCEQSPQSELYHSATVQRQGKGTENMKPTSHLLQVHPMCNVLRQPHSYVRDCWITSAALSPWPPKLAQNITNVQDCLITPMYTCRVKSHPNMHLTVVQAVMARGSLWS